MTTPNIEQTYTLPHTSEVGLYCNYITTLIPVVLVFLKYLSRSDISPLKVMQIS